MSILWNKRVILWIECPMNNLFHHHSTSYWKLDKPTPSCVSRHGLTASHGSLSLTMWSLLTPRGFGLMTIVIPNKWSHIIGHEFDTHPHRIAGEIVGHCINQHSLCALLHGLTTSRGSLSMMMRSLITLAGFGLTTIMIPNTSVPYPSPCNSINHSSY